MQMFLTIMGWVEVKAQVVAWVEVWGGE